MSPTAAVIHLSAVINHHPLQEKGKLNNVFGLLSPLLQVTKGRCIYEIVCIMLLGVPLVADTAF